MSLVEWVRSRSHVVVPAAVVALAAVVLLAGLGSPARIYFDEVYYVNDARDFLEFGIEDGFVVHPPLGKMLIALSIWLFGDTPFGWRVIGAVLGVVGVWLVYDIGRRLGLRPLGAGLAAMALALDGLWITQSRIAMLDIHLAFFVVLGVWCLLRDRDHVRGADDRALASAGSADDAQADDAQADDVQAAGESTDTQPHLPTLPWVWRWWLVAAGISLGLATAVKWSGALAVVGALAILIGLDVARRRRVLGRALADPMGIVLGVLVVGLVSVATYAVAWTPFFVSFDDTWIAEARCDDDDLDCDGATGRLRALARFHSEISGFHSDLDADHGYRAPATGWPIQHRPVVYYYETCSEDRSNRVEKTDDDGTVTVPEPCSVDQGQAAEIIGLGNPALWWGALALLPLFGAAVRRRPAATLPIVAMIATQFGFWVLLRWVVAGLEGMPPGDVEPRPVFNFYAVPVVPFLALGAARALHEFARRDDAWWVLGAGIGSALVVAGGGLGAMAAGMAISQVTLAYTVGIVALVTGWIAGNRPAPELAPSDTPVQWMNVAPWAVAALLLVVMALWFLPIWTAIPLPSEIVRAHWWLTTWI